MQATETTDKIILMHQGSQTSENELSYYKTRNLTPNIFLNAF